jgi:hypothetical protein
MKSRFFVAAGFLLTACQNTGVLPAGPNTYMISVYKPPIVGGGSAAQRDALTQANQYCISQGLNFMPTQTDLSTNPFNAAYGPTTYAVTFECLKAGDPQLQPPNFQRAPDVVIENRSD